jgi:nucleoside-diphosphate-sugar epimerase
MRILVTGATGFIGSRLALRARARGHEVRAAGRRLPEGLRSQFAEAGIDVDLGDVTQSAYVDRIMAGVTHVCHLASAWQEVGVADDYFQHVTVDGAGNVASAASAHGVSKLIYCSTCGVHSRSAGGVITETSPIVVTRPNACWSSMLRPRDYPRSCCGRRMGMDPGTCACSSCFAPSAGSAFR